MLIRVFSIYEEMPTPMVVIGLRTVVVVVVGFGARVPPSRAGDSS